MRQRAGSVDRFTNRHSPALAACHYVGANYSTTIYIVVVVT
jgi:hypothetical protein